MKGVIATAAFLLCVFSAVAAPTWPLPDGVKTVEVNGYPMAYQETGNGTPLVLVHGSLNDYRAWAGQVPEFARKHRVIAVSLRHYFPEKWDGSGDDFSVQQHADDVVAFVKAVVGGKVHLLGHSRGGAVVISVAKRHPEVIQSLILADASGLEALLPESPDSARLATEGRTLRERLAAALQAGEIDSGMQAFVDALSAAGAWSRLPKERKQIALDNAGTAIRPEDRPTTNCADLARFDFPVLLLNGEKSPKRYAAMYEAMRTCRRFPAPTIILGAAHNMHRDSPVAFNAAVMEFLAGH